MKALAVQLLGHPGQRLSRLAELVDSIQEPPVVGHLLVTLHRAHQLVAAAKASCPVDGHVDPFALPTDGGDHLLDQEADDPLAIRCRRSRRLPQPRQLLRQGMDLVALASRQTRGLVAAEPGVFLLETTLLLQRCESGTGGWRIKSASENPTPGKEMKR